MPKKRSYRLLCPISRALDKVGDRWTLLILRDLHAGPARFGEIQAGLTGVASNLLASRLRDLQDNGLVRRVPAAGGAHLYELTPDGEATAPLLFDLANYGGRFSHPEDARKPGNLRTIAVTLKEALRRAADPDSCARVEFVVDEEAFAITIDRGEVMVHYRADPDAPVSIATDYLAMIAVADGDMAQDEFAARHVEVLRGPVDSVRGFMGLMARGFAL
jgi:DNA-binding HxlR family transcriptional regulator